MKVADRIGFEFAFGRGFAFDLPQPGNPMALQTPVKGRVRQIRDGGLQRVKATIATRATSASTRRSSTRDCSKQFRAS
jgi:hypothetical protein